VGQSGLKGAESGIQNGAGCGKIRVANVQGNHIFPGSARSHNPVVEGNGGRLANQFKLLV
jgi:hypothetical protein